MSEYKFASGHRETVALLDVNGGFFISPQTCKTYVLDAFTAQLSSNAVGSALSVMRIYVEVPVCGIVGHRASSYDYRYKATCRRW